MEIEYEFKQQFQDKFFRSKDEKTLSKQVKNKSQSSKFKPRRMGQRGDKVQDGEVLDGGGEIIGAKWVGRSFLVENGPLGQLELIFVLGKAC